jgi:hypothetical protein
LQLLLGLSPLFFKLILKGPAGWNEGLDQGELVLICVVLVGSDVARAVQIIPAAHRRFWRACIVGGGTLFCIASAYLSGQGPARWASYAVLGLAVVFGLGTLYLDYLEDPRSVP